jgi:RND family efflux transporter MFP subunit
VSRRLLIGLGLVLLLLAAIVAWGIFSRLQARAALESRVQETAITRVVAYAARAEAGGEPLVLPGTLQAYADTAILARTDGYLKRWYVDIGSRVRAGQLLAEIDTPEVDQQFRQAQADLANAQANERLARITYERWRILQTTEAVSRQEADEKAGDYEAKRELTASARANLRRLSDLRGFQRVVAPFDGTITERNTDVGRLITTANSPLFHIVDARKLRIYVQVPQVYAASMRPGLVADMRFPDHPGRSWQAVLVRTADAIDAATRTLQTELQIDNNAGELLPGAYAEIHFRLPGPGGATRIPVSALIFRGNYLQVGIVGPGNRVILRRIQPGRDFGNEIEVLSGLAPGDRVIVNPPDSLVQDQAVLVVGASP